MDAEAVAVATSARNFMDAISKLADDVDQLTPLGRELQEFLGVELDAVDPITEAFPAHQVVDVDQAVEEILGQSGGRRIGVAGAYRNGIDTFGDLLVSGHARFRSGSVNYVRAPTGPDSDRRVVALGIALLTLDGQPVVALQRTANRMYGREQYTIEVLATELATADAFLAQVRAVMAERSILRGQIISFQPNHFDYHAPGEAITFLSRPAIGAEQVILPDGVLERITRHVVGVGESRDQLRAAGQHLKRGVLFYGPPGTGKTHVIRHLLTVTEGTTAILLSGRSLGGLNDAAKLARAAQPAIIVLEDCDLIAEHRGGDTNAMLFETLEAMDGLDGDADVTFILTTNRPDLLERALVERPGRVDLAVHIGKPDLAGRRRLFELYGAQLLRTGALSDAALDAAAERTEHITASFVKEVIRRCVLDAARDARTAGDADLEHALDEMLSDAELLTRTLLGGTAESLSASPFAEEDDPADVDHGDEIFDGRPHPGRAPYQA